MSEKVIIRTISEWLTGTEPEPFKNLVQVASSLIIISIDETTFNLQWLDQNQNICMIQHSLELSPGTPNHLRVENTCLIVPANEKAIPVARVDVMWPEKSTISTGVLTVTLFFPGQEGPTGTIIAEADPGDDSRRRLRSRS